MENNEKKAGDVILHVEQNNESIAIEVSKKIINAIKGLLAGTTENSSTNNKS